MNKQNIIKNILKIGGLLSALALSSLPETAGAATVVSSESFRFAYGFEATSATPTYGWLRKESGPTADPGNVFTYTPSISGAHFSAAGPNYDGTTLSNGTGGYPASGRADQFSFSIAAVWNGNPSDIAPGLENSDVQFRLVITSIKVYALHYGTAPSAPTLALEETTSGHQEVFAALSIPKVASGSVEVMRPSANYTLLEWNPTDYWIDGTSLTRTFEFAFEEGQNVNATIDGFQIEGYIEVIPEPSSIALLGGGLAMASLVFARKRRSLRVGNQS